MEPTRPISPMGIGQPTRLGPESQKALNVAEYLNEGPVVGGRPLAGRAKSPVVADGKRDPLSAAVLEELKGPSAGTQGVTLRSLDAGALHRGELHLRMRSIDGQPALQVEFDLMPAAHNALVQKITSHEYFSSEISQRFHGDDLPNVSLIKKSAHDFFFLDPENREFSFNRVQKMGRAFEIDIGSQIRILVGDPQDGFQAFRRRMWVQVLTGDIQNGWDQVQKALSAVGLESLCKPASEEQVLMRRVMLVLHQMAPQLAYEISQQSWESMTLEDLELRCRSHEEVLWVRITQILNTESSTPVAEPTGGAGLAIPGLVAELRKKGAIGLMRGVDCSLDVLAHMSSYGSSSARRRWESGWIQVGTSTDADFRSGGGANVFARLVTRGMLQKQTPIAQIPYSGTFQLLYSLDVMAGSCYGYLWDRYGTKEEPVYSERPALDELVTQLNQAARPWVNEIMIPDHLPASYLRHIVVESEANLSFWLDQCREEGLVEVINGREFLRGAYQKPLEELFIAASRIHDSQTGERVSVFRASMWLDDESKSQ